MKKQLSPNFSSGVSIKSKMGKTIFVFLLMLFNLQFSFAQFKVIGYVPTWAGNVSDVQFTKLTHINYAFLIPTSSGGYNPIENAAKLQSLVSAAHANNVKVLISVGGGGGGNAFKTIVPSASLRTTFVNNMVKFMNQYNLDGVDIDWEFPSSGTEANNFALLMAELSTAMHSRGKLCTAAVIAYGGTSITNSVFNSVDFLNVMAYDENSYTHSTYELALQSVNYWVGRGLPANKCVLGVPFYGRDNRYDYSTLGYNEILAKGGSPNSDTFSYWGYNGIPTMKKKTSWALTHCGGIMIWSLDTDAKGANSLLSAIDVVVKAGTTPNVAPTVSLTSPANNSTFAQPASITINANAADSDGTVTKVDFYNGATLLGTDATAPYSFTWTNAAVGSYSITAKATDNSGAVTTSAAVAVTVTLPACQPVSDSGNDGNVAANVLDGNLGTRWSSNGYGQWISFCFGDTQTVKGVQIAFYNGNARVSTFDVQVSDDGVKWINVLTGAKSSGTSLDLETFTFAAKTTKNVRIVGHGNSLSTWNSYTEVKMFNGTVLPPPNVAPTASITSPVNSSAFTAPATINISANAADSDGTVTQVEFYNGTTLLGSDATAPYSFAWTNVAIGVYTITVKATDNAGAVATSSAITVNVNAVVNNAPTASIAAPINNATFTAPASVTINANATDSDGTIAKVDFYNGTTLLGSDATSPYSYSWTNVAAGTYTLTVKATDNAGAVTTSSAVTVKVNTPVTNTCAGIAAYKENSGYVAGSVVTNGGSKYQCKPYPYTGWCNGAAWAYAPGTGTAWADAWTKLGSCSSARVSTTEESSAAFSLSPNPATGIVRIESQYELSSVVVINNFGEEVYKAQVSAGSSIDLSSLPTGIYLVKINSGEEQFTQRLVLQ